MKGGAYADLNINFKPDMYIKMDQFDINSTDFDILVLDYDSNYLSTVIIDTDETSFVIFYSGYHLLNSFYEYSIAEAKKNI